MLKKTQTVLKILVNAGFDDIIVKDFIEIW